MTEIFTVILQLELLRLKDITVAEVDICLIYVLYVSTVLLY